MGLDTFIVQFYGLWAEICQEMYFAVMAANWHKNGTWDNLSIF